MSSANDDTNETRKKIAIDEMADPAQFTIHGAGTFTLRPSPEFLKDLAFVHVLDQKYDYEGVKITEQMHKQIEAQINRHMQEAYLDIAKELNFDVSMENGKMMFMQNGAPITMDKRLQMENLLQERFNRYAFADNIIMVNNPNVNIIEAQLGVNQDKQNEHQLATPFNMTPLKNRPEPK